MQKYESFFSEIIFYGASFLQKTVSNDQEKIVTIKLHDFTSKEFVSEIKFLGECEPIFESYRNPYKKNVSFFDHSKSS